MCLGGQPSTPAPTNVKDNSMYYNGNVFDPKPEEIVSPVESNLEIKRDNGGRGKESHKDRLDKSSGLNVADRYKGIDI